MNPRRSRSPILGVALTAAVLGGVALASAPLEAQRPPARKPAPVVEAQPTPGTPCCDITAIDVRGGLVTARNAATGESFRFRVSDAGLLRGLTVGQKVYRAEGSDRVGFTPSDPCCDIVSVGAEPVADAQPTPGEACCAITAIDVRSGLVTARNAATGESFRFRVTDAGVLRGLTVGQKVYRAEGSDRAGITPATPCCDIVAAPAAANPAAVPRPTPAQPVDGIAPCCNITAIDVRSGLVTARNAATGESFRFRVTDAGVLRGLTVGQKVYRAEGSDRAGFTPGDPCCAIVAAPGAGGA